MKKGGMKTMEERNRMIRWIKAHKKGLIAAGVSVGTVVLIILGIKKRDAIKAMWDSLKEATSPLSSSSIAVEARDVTEDPPVPVLKLVSTKETVSETLPFEVCGHIRNLPAGWHASPEKIAEAQNNNIILFDGQTWVDSYMKGVTAV